MFRSWIRAWLALLTLTSLLAPACSRADAGDLRPSDPQAGRPAAEAPAEAPGSGEQGSLEPPAPAPRAVLAFTGDVMLADRIGDLIKRDGSDAPWEGVAVPIQRADFALCNLEGAVGRGGVAQEGKAFTFRADPAALEGLKRAGIDGVSLGNNHVLDFGEAGLRETLANLDRSELLHSGAGQDQGEAYQPFFQDLNGVTVGFLSLSRVLPVGWAAGPARAGVASAYDEAASLAVVKDAAARCDVLVVSLHWGEENKPEPQPAVQRLARRLVDAGADLVVGHHPHVWQGLSSYNGALIAYSLGNFVFTTGSNPEGIETGILEVEVTRDGVRGGRILPARITWGRTQLADREQGQTFLKRIRSLSDLPLDSEGVFQIEAPRRSVSDAAH